MKDYFSRACLALILTGLTIFALSSVQPASSQSGGWVFKSSHAPYRIDRVCQDGYEITVVNRTANGLTLDTDNSVVIQPAVWVTKEVSEAWRGTSGSIAYDYFPKVGSQVRFEVGAEDKQDSPIIVSGSEEFHYRSEIIPFGRPLATGKTVALGNNAALIENTSNQVPETFTVEDCHLFETMSNEVTVFTPERLMPYASAVYSDSIKLEVLSIPATGTIESNGVELGVGDQVSLSDIHANGLIYKGDESTELADSFTYRVNGTVLVSLDENGEQISAGGSKDASISADGSKIAFTKNADFGSIGSSEPAIPSQILVMDLSDKSIMNTSQNFEGQIANGFSWGSSISPDGRFVSFTSEASDIFETDDECGGIADTNDIRDIFVREITGPSNVYRASVFDFDTSNSTCEQINEGFSFSPSLADARAKSFDDFDHKVDAAFATSANFPEEIYDFDNGLRDILVHDGSATSTLYSTDRISIPSPLRGAPNGATDSPAYAADGSAVAFRTSATNLLDNDTNGETDVILWIKDPSSVFAPSIYQISVNSNEKPAFGGDSGSPAISQHANHIAFTSKAINLDIRATGVYQQIFIRDFDLGCTTLLSANAAGIMGDDESDNPSISADGRFVSFHSTATNLVEDDTNRQTDIFLVDRDADGDGEFYSDVANCIPGESLITRASMGIEGAEANSLSANPVISANGEFIAYESEATNLVNGDTNRLGDVFLHYIGFTRTIEFKAPEPNNSDGSTVIYLPLISR